MAKSAVELVFASVTQTGPNLVYFNGLYMFTALKFSLALKLVHKVSLQYCLLVY